MKNDEETSPQLDEPEACVPEQPTAGCLSHEERQHISLTRKDKNRLHATRHGVLSRHPLEPWRVLVKT